MSGCLAQKLSANWKEEGPQYLYDKFANTRRAEFERGLQDDDKKKQQVLDRRLKELNDTEVSTRKSVENPSRRRLLRFTAKDKHRILANELMMKQREEKMAKELERDLRRVEGETSMEKYEAAKQKDLQEKMKKVRAREEREYNDKKAHRDK